MVERWMKERAAKSFGGPCMSKFVQENERKRILRLKNMKSSISRSASNKHDHWTQNQVDKRHREIRKNKVDDGTAVGRNQDSSSGNPDFDLCFPRDVDVTKSGLKLKLNNATAKPKRSTTFRTRQNDSIGNGKKRIENSKSEAGTDMMDQNHTSFQQSRTKSITRNHEEKENQSPITSEDIDVRVPKKPTAVSINSKAGPLTSICETTKSVCRNEDRKAKVVTSNGRDQRKNNLKMEKKTKHHNQISQKVSSSINKNNMTKRSTKGRTLKTNNVPTKTRNKNLSRSNLTEEEGRKMSGKKYAVSNSKQQQLHANRGVTLESLSKEKEEALAMLREIDTKTSCMEIKIDGGVRSQEVVEETLQTKLNHTTLIEKVSEDFVSSENSLDDDWINNHLNNNPTDETSNIETLHSQEVVVEETLQTKSNDTTLAEQMSEDFLSSANSLDDNLIKNHLNNLTDETSKIETLHSSPTIQGKDELVDSGSRNEISTSSNDSTLSRISSENPLIIPHLNVDGTNDQQLSSEGSSVTSYSENFESEMVYTDSEKSCITEQKREISSSNKDNRNNTTKEHYEIDESVDWTPQFKVESFFVHQS